MWNVTQRTSAVVAAAAEVFVADFRQQLLSLPLLLASTPFKTEPISITFAQPPKGRAKRIFFVTIEGLLEPVVLNLSFRVRSNAMFTSERRY